MFKKIETPIFVLLLLFVLYCAIITGSAWDELYEFSNKKWPSKYGVYNLGDYSPWVVTAGIGVKINLGYFLLRIESAWDKNPDGFSKPQWYFSLGPDW